MSSPNCGPNELISLQGWVGHLLQSWRREEGTTAWGRIIRSVNNSRADLSCWFPCTIKHFATQLPCVVSLTTINCCCLFIVMLMVWPCVGDQIAHPLSLSACTFWVQNHLARCLWSARTLVLWDIWWAIYCQLQHRQLYDRFVIDWR